MHARTGRQRPAVTNPATMHYGPLVLRKWSGKVFMQRINVLNIQRISAEDRAKIEAVDPALIRPYLGAREALRARRADMVRHVLVSLRELWNHLLHRLAPDEKVLPWIQQEDTYILIRYLAARDDEGTYKGTLEVTQDISRIREIEGERRLLDWDAT